MVLVFKTSVCKTADAKKIVTQLNANPQIGRCNFDLQDIDNILRIETDFDISDEIVKTLLQLDFFCEELL